MPQPKQDPADSDVHTQFIWRLVPYFQTNVPRRGRCTPQINIYFFSYKFRIYIAEKMNDKKINAPG